MEILPGSEWLTRFVNFPALVILLGAIIIVVGAWWAVKRQARERTEFEAGLRKRSDEQRARREQIAGLMGKQVELQQELQRKAEEQAELERELRLKSDEIAQLNRELADSVIGGDSFCYLAVASLNSTTNRRELMVVHQGKHNLYDVQARIVDLRKFDTIKDRLSIDTMPQAEINISIGNLTPGSATMIRPFELGRANERGFKIFFVARNGGFTQELRFKKIDRRWFRATRVEMNEKEVYRQVDKEYPLNSKGEVDW